MKKNVLLIMSFLALMLSACSYKNEAHIIIGNDEESPLTNEDASASLAYRILPNGYRDNTPVCLTPVASGSIIYSNQYACIDASNATEGYIMVKYTGSNPKVKLQIVSANTIPYTYNLTSDDFEAFPLSSGSGEYKISVYENVEDTKYTTALAATFTINVLNTFGPNLYPNQYCNFTENSLVVSKAMDLSKDCKNDLEVVAKVYEYITTNISYDHDKAATVQSGYTCNVDEILLNNTGICLDYASVMTCMLRSQNIPTRLEVGYAGSAYHAWISTYIKDIGWVNGIVEFDGENWSLMDPTFAANSSTESLKNFIGNGSNYQTKYIY